MAAIRDELSWEQTLRPLMEFCRSGESIAAPKRRRFAPLLPRTLRYLMTHVQQRRMPY
jgi:hypothetical protein